MHRRTDQERPAGAGSAGLPSSGVDARAGEMFVRSAGSGLLLPDRLATPQTPSGVEWHVVRGTWGDVYGEDPSWDDAASRLSGYGLGQVLAILGGVSAILNSSAPVEGQRRIIAKLFEFPDQVGRDFQAWWDREKPEGLTDFPLFFSEPQVVAAAKIALLACPPVTHTQASSLDPLGESLLMVGDLLDREDAGDLPPAITTPADRIPWLRYLVTNGLFNASENLTHALARTHDLYLTDRPELRDEPEHIDLPRRFRETTGLDSELAWTLGAFLFGNWRTVDPKSDRPPGPLSLEALSSSFRLKKQEADAFADYLFIDAAAARTQLRDRGVGPDALRAYDPLPLANKPLVRLEGRVYCPSVRLLRWKLTTGLRHAFLSPGTTRASDRQAYLTYTGRVFENYVERLLRRALPPSGKRFIGERELRQAAGNGKVCDGVILDGDSVVLVEAKATLFPLAVCADGDFDTLRAKTGDIFADAAEQFDGTVAAIDGGALRDAIQPERVSRYLPLVVTLDTLPITPFFYDVVEEAVAAHGALKHAKAQPLQAVAVSELELLEAYISEGGNLGDLLAERAANGTYRDDCLKNYLLARHGRAALRRNPHLVERYRKLVNDGVELLRARTRGDDSAPLDPE